MDVRNYELPDLKSINRGLKDFQRRTARTVFRNLYGSKGSTHRFLVADEVGLGKTLIARYVIAKTLHHLWNKVKRIDIVYICSNTDIAHQNIKRLNVLGSEGKTLPTRITLLPTQIRDLSENRINFISFTPGTSFDLKSQLGVSQERVLLYCLMKDFWNFSGAAPKNVFQGNATAKHFRNQLLGFSKKHPIDSSLAKKFKQKVEERIREANAKDEVNLHEQFVRLCQKFPRSNSKISQNTRSERSALIGELRELLADTCIHMLDPNLVILDEFQRFKSVLDAKDETSALAHKLFNYSDNATAVRVLLLSATPYKMYTHSDESADENHYKDFIDTLRFLLRNDEKKIQKFNLLLNEFRYELLRFNDQSPAQLELLKNKIQNWLRRVMTRTERLAVTADREGMLTYIEPNDVKLLSGDALAYVELQSIARELEIPNTIEYWKSSSYLLNFMEDYKLKRKLHDALAHGEKREAILTSLSKSRHLLLSWEEIEKYKALDPRNARLRALLKQVIDSNIWQLLWLPPSFPYYELAGPFRNYSNISTTKRLIFSSWRVVPKVISTILSYEAERNSAKLFNKLAVNTEEERERRRKISLLRIAIAKDRLTGMPVLALMYPSITLARRYDPLNLARKHGNGQPLKLKQLVKVIRDDISQRIESLANPTDESRIDEQWYWAAPILLDKRFHSRATREWFNQPDLEHQWAGEESRGEEAWLEHVTYARKLVDGNLTLGRQPDDLVEVLTLLALGGPAICSLRALERISGANCHKLLARNLAGRIGWAFRSLYNRYEVTALLRGLKQSEPYWRRILEYGTEGCLQSVLDEYVHVLKNALGQFDQKSTEMMTNIAESIQTTLTIRAAALTVDHIRPKDYHEPIETNRLPSKFAMPFGQGRDDESGDTAASRSQKVRDAFNSPFWPFVVVSTSIGQEGLDFHWYCHAIIHWNLPSNPVDLEQREGRVHRYKGHAVRKNVASKYGRNCFESRDKDPWEGMIETARKFRDSGKNDLVPFWVFPIQGGACIERHVPSLPLTRDRQLLKSLCRSLTVYRMVFGQPRQDDLVEYLTQYVPEDKINELVRRLRIDLSP